MEHFYDSFKSLSFVDICFHFIVSNIIKKLIFSQVLAQGQEYGTDIEKWTITKGILIFTPYMTPIFFSFYCTKNHFRSVGGTKIIRTESHAENESPHTQKRGVLGLTLNST